MRRIPPSPSLLAPEANPLHFTSPQSDRTLTLLPGHSRVAESMQIRRVGVKRASCAHLIQQRHPLQPDDPRSCSAVDALPHAALRAQFVTLRISHHDIPSVSNNDLAIFSGCSPHATPATTGKPAIPHLIASPPSIGTIFDGWTNRSSLAARPHLLPTPPSICSVLSRCSWSARIAHFPSTSCLQFPLGSPLTSRRSGAEVPTRKVHLLPPPRHAYSLIAVPETVVARSQWEKWEKWIMWKCWLCFSVWTLDGWVNGWAADSYNDMAVAYTKPVHGWTSAQDVDWE